MVNQQENEEQVSAISAGIILAHRPNKTKKWLDDVLKAAKDAMDFAPGHGRLSSDVGQSQTHPSLWAAEMILSKWQGIPRINRMNDGRLPNCGGKVRLFLPSTTRCRCDLASAHEITNVLLQEFVVAVKLVVFLANGLDTVEDCEEGFLQQLGVSKRGLASSTDT